MGYLKNLPYNSTKITSKNTHFFKKKSFSTARFFFCHFHMSAEKKTNSSRDCSDLFCTNHHGLMCRLTDRLPQTSFIGRMNPLNVFINIFYFYKNSIIRRTDRTEYMWRWRTNNSYVRHVNRIQRGVAWVDTYALPKMTVTGKVTNP